MDYLEDGGRLYEFIVLAEAHGDEISVECFDMSEEGGLVGTIHIGADGHGELCS